MSETASTLRSAGAGPVLERSMMLRQVRFNLARATSSGDAMVAGLSAEATRIVDDFNRAAQRNPDAAHAAALRLLGLATLPVVAPSAIGGLTAWRKRKIDRYLRDHLKCTVRIDQLAARVFLSVSHFCRAFRHTYGESPHNYIIRLRLERAQELMLSTRDRLGYIALASGFADQAHLARVFRRKLDETPSAWRHRYLVDARVEVGSRASERSPTGK